MSDTDARGRSEDEELNPESRRLCPDDNCIGVIGPDGKCKVCGKESPDGAAPEQADAPKPAAAAEAREEPAPPAEDGEASAFDPESRRLCPDDNCIGVIGPDGKCKVCGKQSPDGPPPAPDAPKAAKPAPARDEKKAAKPSLSGKGEARVFDPDDRVLCSDDCCTGLIGPDGKCKVCGKPYGG